VTVIVGVMLTVLFGVLHGLNMMAMRYVRVVAGLVMVAGFVMLRGRFVVLGGVCVVLSSFSMMLRSLL
jgi:hypothetical protein